MTRSEIAIAIVVGIVANILIGIFLLPKAIQ